MAGVFSRPSLFLECTVAGAGGRRTERRVEVETTAYNFVHNDVRLRASMASGLKGSGEPSVGVRGREKYRKKERKR